MSTILDQFDDIDEFAELLEDAEAQASTEWEIDFVSDISERFDEYEDRMYLSDKQRSTLARIAGAHQ